MKRKRDSLPFTKEQVYAEYEAALMRLALLELQEEELEELEERAEEPDEQEGAREAQLLAAGAIGSIRRRIQTQRTRVFAFEALPRLGKALVSVLLVMAIGFAVAFATMPLFRASVLAFFSQAERNDAEMGREKRQGVSMDIPSSWQGMH